MGEVTGWITDIQRFSLYDGPGIRTTVFFKGCPLHCLWCHNPECIQLKPQLRYVESRCNGCGCCEKACPLGLHSLNGDGMHTIDRTLCTACGACAQACPMEALEITGRSYTVAQVMKPVLADRKYYEKSGGGLTISGGEPLMQPDFLEALLKEAKEHRIHTAIETSGAVPFNVLKRIMPLTDLFLFDYKETAPKHHKVLTGQDNRRILENLDQLMTSGAKVLLRCPIVPGCNDREAHFAGIVEMLKRYQDLVGCELMAYHKLGISKYTELDRTYKVHGDEMSQQRKDDILSWINSQAPRQVEWG